VKDARKSGLSTPSYTEDRFGGGAISVVYSGKDREALDRMQEMISKAQGEIANESVKLANETRDEYQKTIDEAISGVGAAAKKLLDIEMKKGDVERANRKEAGRKASILYNQAEAIRDQLDPLRKIKREALEINKLNTSGYLGDEETRRALDLLIKPTTIPQAMQVNAAPSALGGTYGDGAAVLDIQREVLKVAQQQRDALNRMIQMWSTGSN
jgi:hypothetical protein